MLVPCFSQSSFFNVIVVPRSWRHRYIVLSCQLLQNAFVFLRAGENIATIKNAAFHSRVTSQAIDLVTQAVDFVWATP